MKPLLWLITVSTILACGKNTPGMWKVHGQTGKETVVVLEAQPLVDEGVVWWGDHQSDKDIYWPQFFDHSGDLLQLLSDIRHARPISKKERPDEWEDRPYIQIGETIIYPYLDTMGGRFLSKVIRWSGEEYVIIHDGWWATYAPHIVATSWSTYVQLLRHGQTVEYPYVHDDESLEIRDADSTQVQEAQ